MKIAITGGTGFVGAHLARRLIADGHKIVLISRNVRSNSELQGKNGVTFAPSDLSSVEDLTSAFAACDAVAHCAGINREIRSQTFQRIHVDGTRNVVEAAQRAGACRIALMSFLRARPNCGSPYHESKWAAEELIRSSGLHYTIVKAGMVYGRGDHMLDHLSHSLHTLPFFATVGFREKLIRPLAIDDLVEVLRAAVVDERLANQTNRHHRSRIPFPQRSSPPRGSGGGSSSMDRSRSPMVSLCAGAGMRIDHESPAGGQSPSPHPGGGSRGACNDLRPLTARPIAISKIHCRPNPQRTSEPGPVRNPRSQMLHIMQQRIMPSPPTIPTAATFLSPVPWWDRACPEQSRRGEEFDCGKCHVHS
jgi:uncharacterized protein YbjT (DUF2867 family)